MSYLVEPDFYFSAASFLSFVALACIFNYNRMFSHSRARMSFFKQPFILGMGWLFCSLMIFLPSPFDVTKHFISNIKIHNFFFVFQGAFWMLLGHSVYVVVQKVFHKKTSVLLKYYVLTLFFVYWILFTMGVIWPPAKISWIYYGSTLTIAAYFFIALPPYLIAMVNSLLYWLEESDYASRTFALRFSFLIGFFLLLSTGSDFIFPYLFEGGPNPLYLLRNTQTYTVFMLIVLYECALSVVNYSNYSKIVYHVDGIIDCAVFVYNQSGFISFINESATTILRRSRESMLNMNAEKLFCRFFEISIFEECSQKSVVLEMDGEKKYLNVTIRKINLWTNSFHYILIIQNESQKISVRAEVDQLRAKILQEQMFQQSLLLKMQEESRRKELLLQTMIDNLPLKIAVKNSNGVFVFQNQNDIEENDVLTGITEQNIEMNEKNAYEGVPSSSDRVQYGENGNILKAQRYNYVPVAEKENQYMVIRMVQDITDEMNLELERARFRENEINRSKLEDLGRLTGGIAHDFNNILGAQLGFCELALESLDKSNRSYKYLEEIQKAGFRAQKIIEEMLTSVRSQMVQSAAKDSSFDLQVFWRELSAQTRLLLPQNIGFVVSNAEAKINLFGSDSDLFRIIQNMINNAVYAMRSNGGTLTLNVERITLEKPLTESVAKTIQPGNYAKIDVVDTGEGMLPSVVSGLFRPFFTTKAPGEGTGLGLLSSLSLVLKVQGGITVRSTVGKGSIFSIYWPIVQQEKGVSDG